MLAVLYLLLAWMVGLILVKQFLPRLMTIPQLQTLRGTPLPVRGWMITAPAAFLVGTLLMTWLTYLIALGFHTLKQPLIAGNLLSMGLYGGIIAYLAYKQRTRIKDTLKKSRNPKFLFQTLGRFLRENWPEVLFALFALSVSTFMMFYTLRVDGPSIILGRWVYGDFGPHLSMIRSFSMGHNFPTEYSHYPNGLISYHFMFMFLAGNLEWLGFDLGYAFNVPTILSLTSFFMLLYTFATWVTGYRGVAWLATVFFLLRSSFAFFTYLDDHYWQQFCSPSRPDLGAVIWQLTKNDVWIGRTAFEGWGEWSLPNTYVNQRHNTFVMGIMMLCLLYAFPLFQNFLRSIPNQAILKARWFVRPFVWVREILRETWFSKSAWKPLNLFQALLLGLLLGLCGYWNGAIVIDTLLLLFTLSLVSKQKTEFLAIAAVSLGVAFIQKDFFMGKGMGAFRPEWYFGFQSPDLTLHGVMMYYTEVFGILFPTALIGMLFMPRGSRWLTLVFFTPLIFATLVKMTPEIAANQKFVHISIILINILAASLIFRLFRSPSITTKALGLIMFLLLTITGISDALTFLNVNRQPVIYSMKDPLYLWARDHMKPKEMLLGFVNVGHPVYMAGRRIYMGWPYYGWSAGYDTNARSMIINQIYGGTDIKAVKSLLAANKIDYVMIEPAVRANKDYVLNEKLFEENFKKVFADETNRIYIYKVHSAGR